MDPVTAAVVLAVGFGVGGFLAHLLAAAHMKFAYRRQVRREKEHHLDFDELMRQFQATYTSAEDEDGPSTDRPAK